MTLSQSFALLVAANFVGVAFAQQLSEHRKLNRIVGGQAIPGQYIVQLDKRIPDSKGFATKVLKRALKSKVINTYDYAFKGFAVANLPDTVLSVLLNLNEVRDISEDGVVTIDAIQSKPVWGLDHIDGVDDDMYEYAYTGLGVDAYIIDTGILASHADLEGRVASCISFTGEACGFDLHGHGTHVAGTVGSKTYGVAKQVSLHDVKVLNVNGTGSYANVIAAVDHVTKIKQENSTRKIVMNLSLGGGISTALNTAINSAVDQGIAVAVAAGNNNQDACNYSPASASKALTVGAMTITNARSSFSNWGSCVDIFAPGSSIVSLSSTGGTSTKAGTSMASPHVAGVAALYLEAGRPVSKIVADAATDRLSDLSGSSNSLVSTTLLGESIPPVVAPTQQPTLGPAKESISLTKGPALVPTSVPVSPPSKAPVRPPTKAPVRPPSKAPVRPPTKAPVKPPVRAPVKPPVRAPIKPPVKPPVRAPVKPPVRAPVEPPVRAPVRAPVKPPVRAPVKN
jgi:subtilisin family serine protease